MPRPELEVPQLRLLVVGLHAPMNVAGSQTPFGMTEAFFRSQATFGVAKKRSVRGCLSSPISPKSPLSMRH